jgi:hypothetical protein
MFQRRFIALQVAGRRVSHQRCLHQYTNAITVNDKPTTNIIQNDGLSQI